MAKRDFLMLAQTYDAIKHRCMGWYASEKLDGIRCFYDGGITTGKLVKDVPWANIDKHHRFVNKEIFSTGLWSRYGQVIRAPKWWIETLPKIPLDGELTMGRGTWQELSSTIKRHDADERWEDVQFKVFDIPPQARIFADGKINGTNYKKEFRLIYQWFLSNRGESCEQADTPFYKTYALLGNLKLGRYASRHEQSKIPDSVSGSQESIQSRLLAIEDQGGEGLILRSPVSFWKPERSYDLLKVKSLHDMEGTVVGYKWAKPTDLGKSLTGETTNKLLGLMGSLRLRLDSGVEFDLSGFTDAERVMTDREHGLTHPGEVVPESIHNPLFKRGEKVTFRYRELSGDGCPKEARYWRKHS